jgi:toxoflavin biosynthesis protein ToxD
VTGVTWYEAEAYCRWLGAHKHRVVRLPTEEEWEKAARGTDGRLWPWGDQFGARQANTYEYGALDTLAAGHLAEDVSPYGLQDMGGNVQEWTATLYHPLPDEVFPEAEVRVARGGSWNDTAFGARASFRHAYPPGYYFPFLGFRIVVGRL